MGGMEHRLLDDVIVIGGDLCQSADVQAAVDYAQPDEVYNLAGISSVALSWQEPILTADVTGLGLLRIISAVGTSSERYGRQSRIVQASSAEIFGGAVGCHTEDSPIAPDTPSTLRRRWPGSTRVFIAALAYQFLRPSCTAMNSPRRPETFVTRKITRTVARITRRVGSATPRKP